MELKTPNSLLIIQQSIQSSIQITPDLELLSIALQKQSTVNHLTNDKNLHFCSLEVDISISSLEDRRENIGIYGVPESNGKKMAAKTLC